MAQLLLTDGLVALVTALEWTDTVQLLDELVDMVAGTPSWLPCVCQALQQLVELKHSIGEGFLLDKLRSVTLQLLGQVHLIGATATSSELAAESKKSLQAVANGLKVTNQARLRRCLTNTCAGKLRGRDAIAGAGYCDAAPRGSQRGYCCQKPNCAEFACAAG